MPSSSSSSCSHRRSTLLFLLFCLSLSCVLFLASAQSDSSSSSTVSFSSSTTDSSATAASSVVAPSTAAASSSSAVSPTTAPSSSAASSLSHTSSLHFSSSSSSASTGATSPANFSANTTTCSLRNPQDNSTYIFALNNTAACCHNFFVTYDSYYNVTEETTINTTVNGTVVQTTTYTNVTLNNQTFATVSVCNVTAALLTPASTLEMIQNATCPMVNEVEVPIAEEFDNSTIQTWCAGGQVDNQYVCDPAGSADTAGSCPPTGSSAPQGPQQDSIYSPNPPIWWRCNYTSPTYSFYNQTLAALLDPPCTNTTDPTQYNITEWPPTGWAPRCLQNITGTTTSGLTVVDPTCSSDGGSCTPRKYLTQINTIFPNGSRQWNGQYLPPYSQYNYHPIAIVVAGSAYVNATLFYPVVDSLQLLEVYNSYNRAFLSLSSSTRIVVETIGGYISNSRTRINGTCAYVVPFFTLIVDMSKGYINKVYWQDDCSTCTSEAFVYSDDGACNCGVPIHSCIGYNASVTTSTTLTSTTSYANNSVSCDVQIYIAYSGTDSGGSVLTSASRTIANFRKWSLNSLYQSAVGFYSGIPSITDNFSNCKVFNDAKTVCLQYNR